MRWRDPEGNTWASRFEYQLFTYFRTAGADVRRCEKRDAVDYTTRVRDASCESCGSGDISQAHTYTPDLCVRDGVFGDPLQSRVEAKGYLRASDRRILRAVVASGKGADLCLILQRQHAKTVDWAKRFLKRPVYVFSAADSRLTRVA